MILEQDWARSPLVITVAPIGAEVTREHNPAVPYTPAEIASEVVAAHAEGAAVAHLHAREPDGTPSARPELFVDMIDRIRSGCGIVTMVSTGGALGMSVHERATGLEANPEMAGLEVGSINYGDTVFATSAADARGLAGLIAACGAAVEVEAFEVSHIEAAVELRDAGVLSDPLRFNLVVGVPGGLSATVRNLQMLATSVPADCHWTVTAIGRHQRRILAAGILLGASGVRVGFEDNVYEGKGRLSPSNAALVRQIRAVAEMLGRRVATADEARDLLRVGAPRPSVQAPIQEDRPLLDRPAPSGVRSEGIESGPAVGRRSEVRGGSAGR